MVAHPQSLGRTYFAPMNPSTANVTIDLEDPLVGFPWLQREGALNVRPDKTTWQLYGTGF